MTAVPPNRAVPPGEDSTVSARLTQASSQYATLPVDVATRLDRVLDELPDLEPPPTPAPIPSRQPWWRRGWILAAATTGVAAVFAGVVFFAMSPTMLDAPTTADAGASDGDQGQSEFGSTEDKMETEDLDGNDFGTNDASYRVTYSGHDYVADGLDYALAADAGTVTNLHPALVPMASDPAKLDVCVAGAAGRVGGTVTSVDFGTFEGDPTVVVVVVDEDGNGTIVAQRPACADVGYDAYHAAPYGD
ncbi:MAG TPA: hypothetical protein H9881_13820 [Candidatus Stackebrandtia excrementipullorum]|nr:hypothetical protein [Candidatus Stackebrandtia excrementipullorum]